MRKMINKYGCSVNVVEWIMTVNFWEYYIMDQKETDDIVLAVVMGFDTEAGDISLEEIRPYIKTRTKDLSAIEPAAGYRWAENI